MVSKATKLRRKELRALANIRCFQHCLKNCDKYYCQSEVKKKFYGRKKKRKQIQAPQVDIETLFYRLRHPVETYFESLPDFPEDAPTPITPAPVVSIPAPVSDPTWGLTLRERIKLAKVAA
jgi:hypothetical protein